MWNKNGILIQGKLAETFRDPVQTVSENGRFERWLFPFETQSTGELAHYRITDRVVVRCHKVVQGVLSGPFPEPEWGFRIEDEYGYDYMEFLTQSAGAANNITYHIGDSENTSTRPGAGDNPIHIICEQLNIKQVNDIGTNGDRWYVAMYVENL